MDLTTRIIIATLISLLYSLSGLESSDVIFRRLGTTFVSSTYGHLVIPASFEIYENHTTTLIQRMTEAHNLLNRLRQKSNMTRVSLNGEYGGLLTTIRTSRTNMRIYKQIISQHPSLGSLGRRKRQLGMALGAGVVATMGLLGWGIFSQSELSAIHRASTTNSENINILASQMDQDHLRINAITHDMKRIEAFIVSMVHERHQVLTQELITEVKSNTTQVATRYAQEMNYFFEGLESLLTSRLSPLLVNSKKLMGAFQALTKKAWKQQLFPIVDSFSMLFACDVSPLLVDGELKLIVHIPLVSSESMQLMRFIPAPIIIGNLSYELDTGSQNVIALNPSETFIKVIPERELLECKKWGDQYFCENSNVLNKELDQFCLYSLYKGSKDGIRTNCNPSVTKPRTHVVQLDESTFRVSSPQPQILELTCKNGTKTQKTLEGMVLAKVPPGCEGTLNSFHLLHDNAIRQEASILQVPLDLQTEDLFDPQFMKELILSEQDIQSVLENLTLDVSQTHPLASVKEKMKLVRLMDSHNQYLAFISTIKFALIGTLGLGTILLIIYMLYKKKTRWGFLRRTRPERNVVIPGHENPNLEDREADGDPLYQPLNPLNRQEH